MPNKTLFKLTGWASILSGLLFVGTVFVPGLFGPPTDILREIESFPGSLLAYGWLGIFASILLLPTAIGLYHKLRDAGEHVQIAVAMFFLGAIFLIFGYKVALETVYVRAPYANNLGGQYFKSVVELHNIADQIQEIDFNIGSFILAVGVGMFGLFGLRSQGLSRGVSMVAIVAGIAGLGWLMPLPIPFRTLRMPLTLLNLIGSVVYLLFAGVAMLKSEE